MKEDDPNFDVEPIEFDTVQECGNGDPIVFPIIIFVLIVWWFLL